jgi:hypothetical protein
MEVSVAIKDVLAGKMNMLTAPQLAAHRDWPQNVLFSGSDGGVEPHAYIADVITCVVAGNPQKPPR